MPMALVAQEARDQEQARLVRRLRVLSAAAVAMAVMELPVAGRHLRLEVAPMVR